MKSDDTKVLDEVLISKKCAWLYYVGKLKAGLVSRVGDHKGLSQNITKFINSYELRKEFGLRAIFIAKKFLNVERCAKLHNIHYKKMLEK